MSIDRAAERDAPLTSSASRAWLGLGAKGLVSIGSLAYIATKIDFGSLSAQLGNLTTFHIIVLIAVVFGQVILAALRWQWLLARNGSNMPLSSVVSALLIGGLFNQVLPSTIGGDVARVWYVHKKGHPLTVAFESVATDRLAGLLVLLLLVASILPFAFGMVSFQTGAALTVLCLGGIAFLALILVMDRILVRWQSSRIPRSLSLLARQIRSLLSDRRGLARVGGISLTLHVGSVFVIYLGACFLGISEVGFGKAFVLVPGILLLIMLPISIGGWGVREGAFVIMLGGIGVPPSDAVAISVVFGTIILAVGFMGLPVWMWLRVPRYPG